MNPHRIPCLPGPCAPPQVIGQRQQFIFPNPLEPPADTDIIGSQALILDLPLGMRLLNSYRMGYKVRLRLRTRACVCVCGIDKGVALTSAPPTWQLPLSCPTPHTTERARCGREAWR